MVDDEERALRVDVRDHLRRRAPVEADAMVDIGRGAERAAVAGVGGDLDAAHEQQIRQRGLQRRNEPVLRDGVVIGEHDEVELARARQRR